MKKFVFLSLTVLLGVSLFLAGCGDPETGPAGTSGSGGRIGDGHVGPGATIAGLQAMIDRYDGTGAELVLDNTTVSGAGIVDFKTVKALIVGSLATANDADVTILNLANADITFAETGGNVALGHANDIAIGKAQHFADKGATGTYAASVSGESEFATVVGGVTAVENLTLGAATQIPAGLKVWVFGTLKVDEDSEQPSETGSKVTAIGTLALDKTPTDTTVLANDAKVDVNSAEIVITAATPTVEITLPDTVAGPRFYLAHEQAALTVNGATTKFAAHVRGNGKLVLKGAVTDVDIIGSGRVQFSKADAAIALADGSSIETGSTGYVQFDGGFTSAKSGSAGNVTLSGNVRIAAGKTIGYAYVGSKVTLKAGTVVQTTESTPATALKAVDDLELTAGAAGSLITVKAGGEVDVSAAGVEFDGDVVFGGNLTLGASGTVEFGGTAWFAATKKITFSAATEDAITLADGGALAIGAPTTTAAVWQHFLTASGTDVTLTPTANTTLTVAESGKSVTQAGTAAHGITIGGTATLVSGSTYTVASEASKKGSLTVAADGVLTLGSGFLMDEEEGTPPVASLVLTGAASNAATLVLKGKADNYGAKLVVDATQTATVTTLTTVTLQAGSASAATDAAVSGTGVAITAAAADVTTAGLLGTISASSSDTNDTTITGPSTAVNSTIAKGTYVKAAS